MLIMSLLYYLMTFVKNIFNFYKLREKISHAYIIVDSHSCQQNCNEYNSINIWVSLENM